jgi:autonomous glycyl radical cofactor GrcA
MSHRSLLLRSRAPRYALLAAAALAIATSVATGQSLSYASGQNISPAYEGWEQMPDGSRYFLFGYMNRNWEEEIDVPIGPDNNFSLGGQDQGQPTHFLPRRNRFVFRVKVPSTFTDKDEIVWTLTTKVKTEKAYATLRTDYQVDDVVKASETGALGAGTSSPEVRANKPPVVKVEGSKSRTVKVGQPLSVVALVKDDGIPKRRAAGLAGAAVSNEGSRRDTAATVAPPGSENALRPNRAMLPPARVTVGKNVGLHLSWFVYRGSGKVTFSPEQVKAWEDTRTGANSPWAPIWAAPDLPADGKVTMQATFEEPGTYVLHGVADDGALFGYEELTVTVSR